MLWKDGHGREDIVDNIETLIEALIEREAEKIIDENKHLAVQTA